MIGTKTIFVKLFPLRTNPQITILLSFGEIKGFSLNQVHIVRNKLSLNLKIVTFIPFLVLDHQKTHILWKMTEVCIHDLERMHKKISSENF